MKRECWAAYHRAHLDRSAGPETAPDSGGRSFAAEAVPSGDTGPEQLVELIEEASERLALLKPAERRALSLIAAGYSYGEVGEVNRWTYTYADLCVMPT